MPLVGDIPIDWFKTRVSFGNDKTVQEVLRNSTGGFTKQLKIDLFGIHDLFIFIGFVGFEMKTS